MSQLTQEQENSLIEEFNKKFCDYYYPCDTDGNGIIKKGIYSRIVLEFMLSHIETLLKEKDDKINELKNDIKTLINEPNVKVENSGNLFNEDK